MADQSQNIPMIGAKIAHYKIIEKLGGGGMGIVYKALDLRLDRLVALKFLPPELTRDADARERFIREAKAASSLEHANICTVFAIEETSDKQFFISMSYIPGETLKKKITRGSSDPRDVLDIAIQIARGLGKAHTNNIVHRDIKPANIMVSDEGEAKIVDFGLAKLYGYSRLTRETSTLGTVAYMSPEQLRGEETDGRSDLWSLGVVLFELLTGQLPFKGEYEQAVAYQILNENPPDVTGLNPDVPPELARIIHRILEKDPDKRFRNAEELTGVLKQLKGESESGISSSGSAWNRIVSGRRRTVKRATVTAVLATLLIVLFLIFNPFRPETPPPDAGQPLRLAVLPLALLSPDENFDYFVDGMTEELIATLSKITRLRIIARTSVMPYKHTTKNIAEIGEELDVTGILEGSVRKAGDRLRITLQLIDVQNQEHLWAQNYDRQLRNVLNIQSEVAKEVAGALQAELLPNEIEDLKSRTTDNFEAYKLYLQGREKLRSVDKASILKALDYFEQAAEADSNYAEAYAGIAQSYHHLSNVYMPTNDAMIKALKAAEKALNIEPSLAEAHTTIACVKAFYFWEWQAAEKEFRYAISLNPSFATVHKEYGIFLMVNNRFNEAINEMQLAKQLDPLSIDIEMTALLPYYYGRKYDLTIAEAEKLIENSPDFFVPYAIIALSYLQKREFDKAITYMKKSINLSRENSDIGYLGHIYASAGMKKEAYQILDEIMGRNQKGEYIRPDKIAMIYSGLNEADAAFDWLDKAYNKRVEELILLPVDPLFDNLRSDKRFTLLVDKIGFKDIPPYSE